MRRVATILLVALVSTSGAACNVGGVAEETVVEETTVEDTVAEQRLQEPPAPRQNASPQPGEGVQEEPVPPKAEGVPQQEEPAQSQEDVAIPAQPGEPTAQ